MNPEIKENWIIELGIYIQSSNFCRGSLFSKNNSIQYCPIGLLLKLVNPSSLEEKLEEDFVQDNFYWEMKCFDEIQEKTELKPESILDLIYMIDILKLEDEAIVQWIIDNA